MNVFEITTNQIIQTLQKGVIPWTQPWVAVDGTAYNRVSDKNYSLGNRMLLGREGEYATYKQWQAEGFQVMPGEKSSFVTFWCEFEDKKADPIDYKPDGTPVYPTHPVLRYYNVFHISQTTCKDPMREAVAKPAFKDVDEAEQAFLNYVAREEIKLDRDFGVNNATMYNHAESLAGYNPDNDEITLPAKPQFSDAAGYYSTAFHMAINSTGHAKRLNRFSPQKPAGVKEELVAEIGAACIMRQLGVDFEIEDTASYIGRWIENLKKDPRLIVSAASQAEKAIRYFNEGHKEEGKQESAADKTAA
ncbi:MAG: DUF1738 domain-containing protein [Clostridia bacterium]|nr:DUF1738 domain-containing protein [Clostridia bacterium]